MNIEVKTNNFLPIVGLTNVLELNSIITYYNYDDNKLTGEIALKGKCIINKESVEVDEYIEDSLPFEIIFTNNLNDISKVNLQHFEFFEVERRGIEIEFTLSIECNEKNSLFIDELSDNITKEIDDKLNKEVNFEKIDKVETIFPSNEAKSRIRLL